MSLNMQKQYTTNSIFTSSPQELTLMLYNALVKFIMQAQHAIEKQNIQTAHNCIIKAKKILLNFQNTLDMKYEVSESMLSMYEYIYKRLTDANIKKDANILAEVLIFAKELRDTWSQAIKIARQNNKS